MYEELLNFDFEHSSDNELRQWFQQIRPIIAKFLEAAVRFCSTKQMSCENCPQRKECDELNVGREDKVCPKLDPYLPNRYEGAGKREEHIGGLVEDLGDDYSDILEIGDSSCLSPKRAQRIIKSIRKIRSDEIFTLYKGCSHIFTKEQWEVICLKLDYGMTFNAIGKILKIEQSTASDRFQRAKKRLEAYYSKNRGQKKRRSDT
jgi:hypothetical protein